MCKEFGTRCNFFTGKKSTAITSTIFSKNVDDLKQQKWEIIQRGLDKPGPYQSALMEIPNHSEQSFARTKIEKKQAA